jgi:hypothetical protein
LEIFTIVNKTNLSIKRKKMYLLFAMVKLILPLCEVNTPIVKHSKSFCNVASSVFYCLFLKKRIIIVFKQIYINTHVVIIFNNNHIRFQIQQSRICLCPFQLRSLSIPTLPTWLLMLLVFKNPLNLKTCI